MQRPIPIINRAVTCIIAVELNDTGCIRSNRDPNESSLLLSNACAQYIAVLIAYVTVGRRAAKVAQTVELPTRGPAVALDLECAAVARIEARGPVPGGSIVVDGFAVLTKDGKALVVAGLVANGREGAGRPDYLKAFGGGGCGQQGEAEAQGEGADGGHFSFFGVRN